MESARRNVDENSPVRRGKGLSVVLWTTQGVLAAVFVLSGVMKFMMPVAQMAKQSSLPVPFLYFIGVCEFLGGIGLVAPALFRIWPVLTPVAACGLMIIMAGATVVSMPMGWLAAIPFLFGALAAFVAYGRFKLRPVRPRVRT